MSNILQDAQEPRLAKNTKPNHWGFLLHRKWIQFMVLALVFTIVCIFLGNWQFARRANARAEITRIDNNYNAEVVNLNNVISVNNSWNDDFAWKRVRVKGHYINDSTIFVRNRPLNGAAGGYVLTAFLTSSNEAIWVNRGWVSNNKDNSIPNLGDISEKNITIIIRLRPSELPSKGNDTNNSVTSIYLPKLANKVTEKSYKQTYGILAVKNNNISDIKPVLMPEPVRDEGPHLSYAVQWYIFAAMAWIALGYFAKEEKNRLVLESDTDEARKLAKKQKTKQAKAKKSMNEEEDAWLDNQGFGN